MIRNRMLHGSASNAAGKLASLGIWFVVTPVLVRALGVGDYGLWILVGSLIAYGSLLDLGIGSAVVRYVADYRGRGDLAGANRVLATTIRLHLVFGGAAIGLSAALAPIVPLLFAISPAQSSEASLLVLLMGITLGISIAVAPATALLLALQRFGMYNIVNAGGSIITALLSVVVVLAGGGVVGMVTVNLVVVLGMRLLALQFVRRAAPEYQYGWRGADRSMVRPILSFSTSVSATQISELLQKKSDELIIGAMLVVDVVTPYALARRLADVGYILTAQFVKVLLPIAAQLHAQDDKARLRLLYVISTRVAVASSVFAAAALAVLGGAILTFWVGPEFADAAPILLILSCASAIFMSQWPAGSVLQAMGRFRPVAVASLVAGVCNVALSIVLVGPLGVTGVALATLGAAAGQTFLFVTPYTMRALDMTLSESVRTIWLPALLPAVPIVSFFYLASVAIIPMPSVALAFVGAAGSILYLLLYLLHPATSEEQKLVRDLRARLAAT